MVSMGNKTNLSSLQIRFLELVVAEPFLIKHYYWTGGTVLSEFYLHHRESEDIDLFTELHEVHVPSVNAFLERARLKLGAVSVSYVQFLGLHSYTLHFSHGTSLKVDFNCYPFPRIETGMTYKKLSVDSLMDIAVNKMQTIATKARSRDFIDLYMIHKVKKWGMSDLIKKARMKFDWHVDALHLASRYLLATEVMDYPRMIIDLPHHEWQQFFVREARKLDQQIF